MGQRENELLVAVRVIQAAFQASQQIEAPLDAQLLIKAGVVLIRELSRVCEEIDYKGFDEGWEQNHGGMN